METPGNSFEQSARAISRMMGLIFVMFLLVGGFLVYLMIDPTLSAFQSEPESTLIAVAPPEDFGDPGGV